MHTVFLVCGRKWDGTGGSRHFVVGVTDSFDLAQQLMTKKAIFMLEKKGLLADGNLTFSHEFEAAQSVPFATNITNEAEYLVALQDLHLASDHAICIHHEKAGFVIKIDEIHHYDESNIDEAPQHWEAKWKQMAAEKLKHLSGAVKSRVSRATSPMRESLASSISRALSPSRGSRAMTPSRASRGFGSVWRN